MALALLLGPMLLGGACFKIEKLPALLLVDDFEDRDLLPLSSKFGRWRCGLFSTPIEPEDGGTRPDPDGAVSYPDAAATDAGPTATPTACVLERGGDLSGFGLRGEYEIANTADPSPRSAGFEIVTPALPSLDVSGFHVIGVSARIELDQSAVPTVEVAFLCDGAWKYLPVPSIRIGADWESFQLEVADFRDPFSPRDPACLYKVDGLRFSVRPGLQDGQTARGSLSIDNVYLEP